MPTTIDVTNRVRRGLGVEFCGREVLTPYTDEEAIELLALVDSSFARDIAARHRYGVLSRNQMAWAHFLVVRDQDSRRSAIRLNRIAEMFQHASGRLQNPRVVVRVDGRDLAFAVGGRRSRWPGAVNVTDGLPYPNSRFYGRIHQDGRWEPSQHHCTPEIVAAIEAVNLDPITAVSNSGRATGRCCFCRLALTDERSVAVGYGAICADHYHLPWGDIPAGQAAQSARRNPRRRTANRAGAAAAREIHTVVCQNCGENMNEGGICVNC